MGREDLQGLSILVKAADTPLPVLRPYRAHTTAAWEKPRSRDLGFAGTTVWRCSAHRAKSLADELGVGGVPHVDGAVLRQSDAADGVDDGLRAVRPAEGV